MHWDIVSVHAHSLSVQEFLVVNKHEDDTPSLYLPDVTTRLFPLLEEKSELAGWPLAAQDSLKTS